MRIGEVAKYLDCTPATIRNYIKRYPQFLSDSATSQRRKRFTPADIEQLRTIQSLLDSGFKYKDIPERLSAIPEILDPEEVNAYDAMPTGSKQAGAIAPLEYFEQINALLQGEQEKHEKHLQSKDETISVLKDENERLRQQLERERLSWWRKLFQS